MLSPPPVENDLLWGHFQWGCPPSYLPQNELILSLWRPQDLSLRKPHSELDLSLRKPHSEPLEVSFLMISYYLDLP